MSIFIRLLCVQSFHFNVNENNLFIAIKVKLLNWKMLILEEHF